MDFEYRDAFVNRDRLLIKKIITEAQPKFYSFLKKYGANHLECKEFFQIALKAISENFIFDTQKEVPNSKFFNYMATIGLNKWRTYCKQKSREIPTLDSSFPDAPNDDSILKDLIKKEAHDTFMQKFRKLGADCQQLLWYRIVEEKRYREIAQLMDKNEESLRGQLIRCKKYLKKLLVGDNNFQIK